MSEQLRQNIIDETLLAQEDSIYVAGPAARRELSNRLSAASKDIDLTAIDVFCQAPTFLSTDTEDVQIKKLQDFREFCAGMGHKVLKLSSANFAQFETIKPLQDKVTSFTDRLTNFGLVEGSEFKINEIDQDIQSLLEEDKALVKKLNEITTVVNDHGAILDIIGHLKDYVESLKRIAFYSKHMRVMYEQYCNLEDIERQRGQILDLQSLNARMSFYH